MNINAATKLYQNSYNLTPNIELNKSQEELLKLVEATKANKTEEINQAPIKSFSQFLTEQASSFKNTLQSAEEQTKQVAQGKANITDLITVLNEAELTLNTVVNIRDKLISAYKDIMNMAV